MGYNSGIKVFIFLFITKEKPTYCIIFLNNLYLYREFECKKMRFDELDLEDAVLDGLYDMNFDETTPVQELKTSSLAHRPEPVKRRRMFCQLLMN